MRSAPLLAPTVVKSTPLNPIIFPVRRNRLAAFLLISRSISPARGWQPPIRTFVLGGSDHPSHTVLARKLQAYLRWRNANARHPDILAAQRRERASIRSQRQQRWGRPRDQSSLTR